MKNLLLIGMVCLSFGAQAISHSAEGEGDTVMIELNNKSKIVIYTEDRVALKDLQQYDLNKMLKDLNDALGSKKINRIELQDENGNKYLKDTTLIFGDGNVKTKIKVGNMELLVDADDWDEIEDEFDDDLPVRKYDYMESSVDRTRHYFNVDVGINNWMEGNSFPDADNQNHTVKPWGSWYVGLNSVNRTWISGPLFFDWGLGVSWYNFKMQDTDIRITKGDDRIEFIPEAINTNSIKSKLTVPYVNVSLVPMLDFAQGKRKVKNLERGSFRFRSYKKEGIRIGAGVYGGYRLGGYTKYVYRDNGRKQKDKDKSNYYLENFRYGVRAQFGYKGLDLFAMYDLNNVFSENRGPAGSDGLNALTFGITF